MCTAARRFSPRVLLFGLKLRFACVPALLAVALLFAAQARAQTAQFSSAQSTIPASGLSDSNGVVVDGSGNIYIADTNNSRVLKETLSGGSYTQSTITASGLNDPLGVAVDGSGNVYIADTNNSRVLKETLSGGSYTQSVIANATTNGLSSPSSVAVDGSDNVYIADSGNSRVLKETLSGGSYTQSTVGSGLSNPSGVAVDGSGNVYIADTYNNRVLQEAFSGGSYTQSTIPSSGLSDPFGVAVDGSGNVYIADNGNSRVLKETLSGGSYTQSTIPTSGLSGPSGVAVDGSGNVYIADTQNSRVLKVQTAAVNFNTVAVGATSAVRTLIFTFDTAGTLAAKPYVALTQGAQGLDFQAAATQESNACITGHTYNAGDVCTVDVVFAPTHPGLRMGAVQLNGSAETPITTCLFSGIGNGPQIIFPSNSTLSPFATIAGTPPTSMFTSPWNIAVDGNGNIYIADSSTGKVQELVAAGGVVSPTTTPITLASGFAEPWGIAVDGAGNVYVSDTTNSTLSELVAVNGAVPQNTTPVTLATENTPTVDYLFAPTAIALDGNGNVYIARPTAILKWTASTGLIEAVEVGLDLPFGLAFDASGNMYAADEGNETVKMFPATNGVVIPGTSPILLSDAFTLIYGLALDGNNNVYVADAGDNAVKELVATNGVVSASTTPIVVDSASVIDQPHGVAVDASGDIFVAGYGGSPAAFVAEMPFGTPPSLTFTPTEVGTSNAVQTVTVGNDGNQALTFPASSSNPNPNISTNFVLTTPATCPELSIGATTPGTLAVNATCTLSVNLEPVTTGTFSGTLVLTDTNLNANPSTTQTIPLNGMGTAAPVDVTGVSPAYGPAAGGNTVTITGSGFGTGAQVSFGSIAASVSSMTTTSITVVVPPGTAGTAVYVTVASDGNSSTTTSSVQYTYQATPTISATAVTQTAGTATTSTITVTGISGTTPTGTVTFWIDSGTQQQEPLVGGSYTAAIPSTLTAGAHTLYFTYSGDTNYVAITTPGTVAWTTAPPPPSSVVVSGYPASVIAGVSATGTITLEDSRGITLTGTSGTATVITSESSTPIPVTITNGIGTFSTSFAAAGTNQTITATFDAVSGQETGISVLASYVVTSTGDGDSGVAGNCPANAAANSPAGNCSLRDAIAAANAAGGNITFSTAVFSTSTPTNINLSSTYGTLTITGGNVTITGPGANLLTVNGGGTSSNFSVFTVNSGATATLSGLTVSKGNLTSSTGFGAGIDNQGTVTLAYSAISGNTAAFGAGIFSVGSMSIVDSTISSNTASGGSGGGISNSGTLTVTESTISNNSASNGGSGSGGGISSQDGALTVTASTVSYNSAACFAPGCGADAGGIFIYSGTLTLANSIVEGNTVSGNGVAYADISNSGGTYYDGGGNLANTSSSATSVNPGLSPLQYNGIGATVQTLIPLPGSPAICAGFLENIPQNVVNDERGFPLSPNGGYCIQLDAGAVQTNYTAVRFIQQPSDTEVNTAMSPSPLAKMVEMNTNTNAFDAVASVPLALYDSNGSAAAVVLNATTAPVIVGSNTVNEASYSLTPTVVGTGFTLSAGSTGNGITITPGTILTATSHSFLVYDGASSLSVSAPATVTVGTPFTVNVTAEDVNGNTVTTDNDTVALTVGGVQVGTLTLTNGVGSTSVTPNTVGNVVLTGTDATPSPAVTGTANIDALAISLTASISATTKTYNASNAATVSCTLPSGVQIGDVVACSAANATFATQNVGTGTTVTATGLTLSGTNAAKYALTSTTATTTANITAAPLTITAVTNSKTYDSTTTAAALPVPAGLQGSDTVTGLAEVYATDTAGTGKTLNVSAYTVNDNNNGQNYSVTTVANTTGVITAVGVTASISAQGRVYNGGTAASVTCLLSGVNPADSSDVSCVTSNAAFASKNVGANVGVTANVALGGSDAGDYTLNSTTTTATAAITAAPLTITAATNSKTYNTTTSAAAVPTVGAGQVQTGDTVTGLAEVYSTAAVGTNKTLTVSAYAVNDGNNGNNYSVSTAPNTTGVITAATVTASVTAANKVYNGTDAATVTGCSLTGVLTADSGNVTCSAAGATFSGSGVANGITVTATGITLNGAAASDYQLASTTATTTANITQSVLTITANNATKVYGAANPTFMGSVMGQQNGDTFTESFSTSATASSAVGSYTITPSITGMDLADYTQSVTTGTLSITQAIPTVSLTSSVNLVLLQNPITLTATASSSVSTPTGSMTFLDGTTPLGTVPLTSGVGALTISSLAVGTHSITAVYSGDNNFVTLTSSATSVLVADFSLTPSNTAQTILPGGTASYNLTLSPLGATVLPSAVILSVTGLPAGATYSFNPGATIAAGVGTSNITLNITAPQQKAMLHQPTKLLPVSLATILLLPFAGLMRRRSRKLSRLCALVLLIGGVAGMSMMTGCGANNGFFSQPQQGYPITVTATSGALTHSTTVILTVE